MNYNSLSLGVPAKVSETVLTGIVPVCMHSAKLNMLCAPGEGFNEGLRCLKHLFWFIMCLHWSSGHCVLRSLLLWPHIHLNNTEYVVKHKLAFPSTLVTRDSSCLSMSRLQLLTAFVLELCRRYWMGGKRTLVYSYSRHFQTLVVRHLLYEVLSLIQPSALCPGKPGCSREEEVFTPWPTFHFSLMGMGMELFSPSSSQEKLREAWVPSTPTEHTPLDSLDYLFHLPGFSIITSWDYQAPHSKH